MTGDLLEFLERCFVEDEALLTPPVSRRMIRGEMVDVPIDRLPTWVERDRARWAAEIAAKRRVVELLSAPSVTADVSWPVLCALALPYADRPGWAEEWRGCPGSRTKPPARSMRDLSGGVMG